MKASALYYTVVLASGLFAANVLAQAPAAPRLEFPSPSPLGSVKQRVGLTDVEITYSRPSVKGRTVFGDLVPFGQIWRTGANASTKVSFSSDVKLNGHTVPAGRYSLFTIPDRNEWTVIIYKNADMNGTTGYNQSNDLVRFKVTPATLGQPVETFTIDVNDLRDDSATINLKWDKTHVPIKLQLNVVSQLQPQIESAMAAAGDRKPYYQAAMFYYDNGLDLKKASEWVDAAVASNEAFYIVHLQAKIRAKLGNKEGAIAAAKRSSELAIRAQGPDSGFVKMNNDLIASLR